MTAGRPGGRLPKVGVGILLAAGASAMLLPWQLAAGPLFGRGPAFGLFLAAALAVELVWVAPDPRRGVRAAAAGVGALAVVGLLVPTTSVRVAAAIGLLAVLRSGLLWRHRLLRAFATEMAFVVSGVVLSAALLGPSALQLAFAVWGFLLVQALYPVVAGARPGPEARSRPADPFENARRQLLDILGEERGSGTVTGG